MLMAIKPRKEVTILALITCPECGRENVSDTAIACPGCGYAIREHFERIRAEEKQYRKSIKETNLQEDQQRVKTEERRIDAVKKINDEIDVCKTNIGLFSFFLVFLLGLMIYTRFSVVAIIFVACDLFILFRNKSKLDERKKLLQLSESNIEQFDKMIEERLKVEAINNSRQIIIQEREIERKRRIEEAQHPVCPNCGSKNTHRISTTGKMVSVGALGLASSTIGKQYKCDDCKHMW